MKVTGGDRLVLDTGNQRFNVTLAEITAKLDSLLGAAEQNARASRLGVWAQ